MNKELSNNMKTEIYIAKKTRIRPTPRKEVVKMVKQAIKNPRYRKVRKHLKRISIIKSIIGGDYVICGTWYADTEKIIIRDHDEIEESSYLPTIIHELGHVRYHFAFKYNKEAFKKFEEVAINHAPLSSYTEDFEEHFKRTKNRDLVSMYADEQHAELETQLYSDKGHPKRATPSDELVQAYNDLHYIG